MIPSVGRLCVGGANRPMVEALAGEIEETVQMLYRTASGLLVKFPGAAGAAYPVRPNQQISFPTTATDAMSMIPALATGLCPRREAEGHPTSDR